MKPARSSRSRSRSIAPPAQIGDDTLFVADYDATRAAGDLTIWLAATGHTRVLGRNATVMSIQPSPNRLRVGFISTTPRSISRAPSAPGRPTSSRAT